MKNNRASKLHWQLPPLVLLGTFAAAQDLPVKAFEAPKVIERVNPDYPSRPLRDGQDGWVQINMMIDETGKPFDILVANAAGHEDFAKAAVDAIGKWRYEPALLDGKPTVAGVRTVMRFQLGEQVGARREFVTAYKRFMQSIKADTQQEAEAQLTALAATEGRNAYELAYLSLARYMYAKLYGNEREQMIYLKQALSNSTESQHEIFLPPEEARSARVELIKLQINNKFYQEALNNYAYFEAAADTQITDAFKPAVEQVNALKTNEKGYLLALALDETGYTSLDLLKRSVFVTDVKGKVAEFNLHCERKFVGFQVEPEVAYDIPAQWGPCLLTVIGDPDTQFNLGQQ